MYWEDSFYVPLTISGALTREAAPEYFDAVYHGDEPPLASASRYILKMFGDLSAAGAIVGMEAVGIDRRELNKIDIFYSRMRGGRLAGGANEFLNPRGLFIAAQHFYDYAAIQQRDITAKRGARLENQRANAITGIAASIAAATRGRMSDYEAESVVVTMDKDLEASRLIAQNAYLYNVHWASIIRINHQLRKRHSNPHGYIIDFIEMLAAGYDDEFLHECVLAEFTDPAIVREMVDSGIDIDLAKAIAQK
jgi:hypothetical protein